MNLNLYNENLDRIAAIENHYVSCLWSEGYNTVENFTLELIATDEYKKKIRTDCFVGRTDRKTLMVITSVRTIDGHIIASGKQSSRVLEDVAFIGSIEPGSNVDTAIKNAYNNTSKFPNMEFIESGIEQLYGEVVESKSMLSVCETMCQETDVGFKVEKQGGSLVFSLYKPEEKENLVFSEKFGNLSINSVLLSSENFKNYAIVLGLEKDGTPMEVHVDKTNGLRRRDLIVDATNVARKKDENNETYLARLSSFGSEELNKYTEIFSCSFTPSANDFGKKYDLGDILTVYLTEYKMKIKARVKKFTQKSQNNKVETTVEVGQIIIKR